MKKIIWIELLLILLLGLCACGGNQEKPSVEGELTWQEQYDLGVRYLSEGNYEEAIIAFTAAIEIDPKRYESYVGRADAYLQSGNNADALIDYEQVIGMGTAPADIYRFVAEMYLEAGDIETAMDILRQGIEQTGDASLEEWLSDLEGPKPLEGYPKSVRGELSVPGYTVKDYNEYGNLVKMSIYTENDELSSYSEYVYDEKQTLTMIVEERFAVADSQASKSVSYVDPQGRCYKHDRASQSIVVSYEYSNGTDVLISYYDKDFFGNEAEMSISYTMQDPGHVVVQTIGSGSQREYSLVIEEYQVTDTYYHGPRTLIQATKFIFDGTGNLLRTEPVNG